MPKKRSSSASGNYEIGFQRPPKKYQFKPGQTGNPKGINRKMSSSTGLDFKVALERELSKPIRIQRGKTNLVVTQQAAGIGELVHQFAKGDHRARRDLVLLCDKYGVDLANRNALQGALEDVLSAADEALLADFVRRHGGQYPVRGADDGAEIPSRDETLLSPVDDPKLLPGPSANSGEPTIKRRDCDE